MESLFLLFPLILMPIFFLLIQRSRKRAAAKLLETLKPEASMRGWAFETESKGYVRLLRWTGADFEVKWVGEALEGQAGKNRNRVSHTRWRTTGLFRSTGTILFIGMPEGTPIPKTTELGDGMLAQLALKAVNFALDKAIDLYFGEEIGAEVHPKDLQRMEALESQVPGFTIMASLPSDATELVQSGLGAALNTHINNGAESLRDGRRPWVLVWKGGVALGRTGAVASAKELDPIVRAGVAIARSLQ